VTLVAFGAALRWRLARSGRVEFHGYAIQFHKGTTLASVRWQDVAGFSDDSADFVKIHSKTNVYPPDMLTVPTSTDQARTAVLALLVERGVPRIEREAPGL